VLLQLSGGEIRLMNLTYGGLEQLSQIVGGWRSMGFDTMSCNPVSH
jgi:hypothetical protein